MTHRLAAVTAVLVATAAVLTAGPGPTRALADGDPASDVLVYQPVFFPYKPAPHALQSHLVGLVRSANQQGYRIRIAIVQSRRDLGSVPALFGRPSVYRALSELGALERLARSGAGRHARTGIGLAQDAHLVRSAWESSGSRRARRRGPTRRCCATCRGRPAGRRPNSCTAAERALRALAARHDVALVAAPARKPASGGGSSSQSRTLAAAVAAAVGLTAGLLWYLWRTRPRRAPYG